MKRAFLIDTDTASDDSVALVMALRNKAIDVKAITIVAGNVSGKQAALNAGYTAELCGADVPLFIGESKPLVRPAVRAHWFHGQDGMGDMHYPPPQARPEREHAVPAIRRLIRENPGITLITLGPLTNIARALRAEPRLVDSVSRCIVMGGNPLCVGNITPAAEYNIYCDPEAAKSSSAAA